MTTLFNSRPSASDFSRLAACSSLLFGLTEKFPGGRRGHRKSPGVCLPVLYSKTKQEDKLTIYLVGYSSARCLGN